MSQMEAVLQGTLSPDGTLVLDEKPNLPAGRVTVRLQLITSLPEGDPFFDLLKGIWTAREQAGLTPRSSEEVELQRRRLREDSEQEIHIAGTLQEDSYRLRQQGKSASGEQE